MTACHEPDERVRLVEAEETTPSQFSDQTYVCWVRMNDGFWCIAIVDPDPPEDAGE